MQRRAFLSTGSVLQGLGFLGTGPVLQALGFLGTGPVLQGLGFLGKGPVFWGLPALPHSHTEAIDVLPLPGGGYIEAHSLQNKAESNSVRFNFRLFISTK